MTGFLVSKLDILQGTGLSGPRRGAENGSFDNYNMCSYQIDWRIGDRWPQTWRHFREKIKLVTWGSNTWRPRSSKQAFRLLGHGWGKISKYSLFYVYMKTKHLAGQSCSISVFPRRRMPVVEQTYGKLGSNENKIGPICRETGSDAGKQMFGL